MDVNHAAAGIDPHKRTATVAVVDVLGVLVISLSFAVTESGVAELLALLKRTCLSIDRIGIEGAGGLGRPLMLSLAAAGYDVRDRQVAAARHQGTRSQGRRSRDGVQAHRVRPTRWRPVNAPHLVALVRAGATFEKGVLIERPDDQDGGTEQVA